MRLILALVLLAGCGSKSSTDDAAPPPIVIDAAPPAPRACAELAGAKGVVGAIQAGGRTWAAAGDQLRADAEDKELVLGVVADARGPNSDTLANVSSAAAAFRAAKVDVVLALGGMGRDRASLEAVLGALADPSWLLVAMPGDRERVDELRAATEALGPAVVDGSRYRLVIADGTAIATLPGGFDASQLPAGADGCLSTAADATTLAGRLAALDTQRVVASYLPPRQEGPGASDRTLDGVHVGRRDLAASLAGAELALVLSANVDEAALGLASGNAKASTRSHLAAGAIDAAPVHDIAGHPHGGAAVIVRIAGDRIRWRRLRFRSGKLIR